MTSEEKLLKLIRKQDQSLRKDSSEKKGPKEKKTDFFKIINGFLLLGALTISVFLVYNYFLTEESNNALEIRNVEAVSKPRSISAISREDVVQRPFSFYQADYEQRDLFEYPWQKKMEEQNTVEAPSASPLEGRLKIVGLVLDENSKAIIEDTQVKQTYFLSVGEEIAGAIVEEITEEKVILKYNNGFVELTR